MIEDCKWFETSSSTFTSFAAARKTTNMFFGVLNGLMEDELSVVSRWVALLSFLTVSWTIWRIWKFTVLPVLYPDEPKAFPYSVPCMNLCSHSRYHVSNAL